MISLPLDIGEPDITPDALDTLYAMADSAPTGGMYPVGASGLWHGGVHLSLGEEPPIYAPTAGRIVAARLDPDPDRATAAYGHTNFILTKHTWPPSASAEEGTPYYMLFMHLAPRPLEAVAQQAGVVPWLTGEPLLRVTAENGLTVRYRPRPGADREGAVPNGALLKPKGEPSERGGYRWQEVGALDQNLEGYVALGPLENGGLKKQWTEEATAPGEADLVGKLEGGEVANLDVPVEAGDMLWWGGLLGQDLSDWDNLSEEIWEQLLETMGYAEPIERAPTVHWEVFAPEKAFGHENTASDNAQSQSEDSQGPEGEESDGENAASNGRITMPTWTGMEDEGEVLEFDPEKSAAYDLIKEKRQAADELPDEENYHALSLDEKKTIQLLEEGKELRTYAVKYASEWGLEKNLEEVLDSSPHHDKEADRADFEAFQFWEEAEALPDSPKVWHYHPVTVLRALAAKQPRFFVEVGGEQKEVSTYEDVRDLIFEQHGVPEEISDIEELYDNDGQDDVPSYTTVVEADLDGTDVTVKRPGSSSPKPFASVEAGHIKDKHGNVTGWKAGIYDFASDTPDLYEMLIEEKKMRPDEPKKGVPDLSDFDANVWASISESEACLKGINTWDRALVTIGPIQQTLGVGGAKGELQGALHTAWLGAPEAYKRRLGRYGLQPKDESVDHLQGAKKAHATLKGEPLDSAGKKTRLQRFEWVDRLAEAFGDPKLRYWMLREGFNRLEQIRNRQMTLEVPVEGQDEPTEINTTIGEIFRRDLSQALLLDWHVNAPGNVWASDNDWRGSVEGVLAEWDDIVQSKDLSRLTRNRELKMVAELLEDRLGNMTNPARRAIGILKYTENQVIKEIAKEDGGITYEGVPTFLERRLGLDSASASERWKEIQSFNRKVLSFERE